MSSALAKPASDCGGARLARRYPADASGAKRGLRAVPYQACPGNGLCCNTLGPLIARGTAIRGVPAL